MKILIFDTNVARTLSKYLREDPNMNKFYQKMKDKGFKLYPSPLVMAELLSHINNDNTKECKICFYAIKAIMLICKNQGYSNYALPAEMIISNHFFHEHLKNRDEMYLDFMNVSADIANKEFEDIEPITTTDGQTLGEFYKNMRHSFAKKLFDVYDQYANKESRKEMLKDYNYVITSFNKTFICTINDLIAENKARPTISSILELAEKNKNNVLLEHLKEEIENINRINSFNILEFYPVPVELLKIVSNKIIASDKQFSILKVENYLQDIMLSFHVSQLFEEGKAIFVTDDKAIIKAAENAKEENGVMKFKDLEKILFES